MTKSAKKIIKTNTKNRKGELLDLETKISECIVLAKLRQALL